MCARRRTCLQQTLKTECRNNGDRLVRRGIQPLNERTSIESIASVMAGILLVMMVKPSATSSADAVQATLSISAKCPALSQV
jgi:hypothetical protein